VESAIRLGRPKLTAVTETSLRLRSTDLDWREVEGEVLALDLRTSRYLAINPTGRTLWGALAEGTTKETMIERLLEGHRIDRSQAEADVDAFITELDERGLLVRTSAGDG
jgi:hypothetical protein